MTVEVTVVVVVEVAFDPGHCVFVESWKDPDPNTDDWQSSSTSSIVANLNKWPLQEC